MISEKYLIEKGWKYVNNLQNGTKVFSGTPYVYLKNGIIKFSFKTIDINRIEDFDKIIYYITGKNI